MGLRHVRRRLRGPPRPAPHPHARGLHANSPAPPLPDRRGAGAGHEGRRAGDRLHAMSSTEVSDYRRREESIDLSARLHPVEEEGEQELLTLNMGPHHPPPDGVLALLFTLGGEVARDLKPIIGYVHTGIEK